MKELKEGSDKWMNERMDGWMDGLMSGKGNELWLKSFILNSSKYQIVLVMFLFM